MARNASGAFAAESVNVNTIGATSGTITNLGSSIIYYNTAAGNGNNPVCWRSSDFRLLHANNGSNCSTASSLRFKHDVSNLDYGLDEIMQLRPVSFIYNDFEDNGERTERRIGFIAEEMNPLVPEVVEWQDGLIYGIDYSNLVSLNTRGIQQLKLQVDADKFDTDSKIASISANLSLTSTGNLSISDNTPYLSFNQPHEYVLNDPFGLPVTEIGAFAELAVAKITAGIISTQQIMTNSLSVATENVSIAGVGIRDYIVSVVNDAIENNQIAIINNQGIISPIASIDAIHTNVISPLADDSNIAVKLDNNQLSIINNQSATGSAVAVIDNSGNASFSGKLASNNLEVANNATISGTLRAQRIIADNIEGLNIHAATVSANYITNNYYNSTASSSFPTLAVSSGDSQSGDFFGIFSGLFEGNNYVDIATFSSKLAYVENLNASTATVANNLSVYGSTTLSDTTVVGQFSVNGTFIVADNSINVLTGDLNLQPLRQGGLSIMAGLIYVDTNGNMAIGNDLTVHGNLFANNISPLPGKDLTLTLSSSSAQQKLVVKGASGSGVLAIDSLGNLISSGAASISKLNINSIVAPALAVSDTEVVATGSAGTAKITSYKKEITIKNKEVTKDSLIYITPTANTQNQVLYLLRQVPGESFTVGVSSTTLTDIPFNWIIVN